MKTARFAVMAVLGGLVLATPYDAAAIPQIDYGVEYMSDYSTCDSRFNPQPPDPLPVNVSMASYFDNAMTAQPVGANRNFMYSNDNVWATDWIEDSLGGADNSYADNGQVFFFTGHGDDIQMYGFTGVRFEVEACHAGYGSTGAAYRSARFKSIDLRWNEWYPEAVASPGAGRLRWAIMNTCHSIEDPINQWMETLQYDMDMVIGYQGTTFAHYSTMKRGAKWAVNGMNNNPAYMFTLNQAWMMATVDAYYSDTPRLVTTGFTFADAQFRRDNMKRTQPYRGAGDWNGYYADVSQTSRACYWNCEYQK